MLDAAASLFAEQGVEQVSLRAIAERADVKLPLIGRYVGTRSEVIDAVLADTTQQVMDGLRAGRLEVWQIPHDPVGGRWVKLLAALLLAGQVPQSPSSPNPVDVIANLGDRPAGRARVRAAECLALVLGWALLEPYLDDPHEAQASWQQGEDDLRALVTLVLSM